MWPLLEQLFLTKGFEPHGYCLLWQRELVWLFIGSDSAITVAYYSIPLALASFVRKREDLAYKWIFLLFGAFIFSCGTTHLMDVIVLWQPFYWLQGYLKFLTAIISMVTAVLLWPLIPKALALKSPAELEMINLQLQQQIIERQAIQAELQKSRDELEFRVQERTADLQASNEKLKLAEAKYRNIFENAREGIFQTTPEGSLITANPALIQMFGYTTFEDLATKLSDVQANYVDPSSRAKFTQLMEEDGIVSDFEYKVYHADGQEFWISENSVAVNDESGKILYFEGSIQNITDRKQAAERQIALESAELKMRELQKLNRLKDDFLSTVSHELRTPMTNIKMGIRLLKDSISEEEKSLYIQMLESQCNREIELINDLLNLQKLEASNKELALKLISVRAWLPSILDPFYIRTRDQEQSFQVLIDPALEVLFSDQTALERILVELINNACKYTPEKEDIQVNLMTDKQTFGDLAIKIQVINSGPGIPEAELSRIFEKFYRVPSDDPWRQSGTGLGLALVKRLIEQLKGTIQVESREGRTTFTIFLPQPSPNHEV